MNELMKHELLSEICNSFNIEQTRDCDYICKAIYSATGKMALASLWDHPEHEKFVSVQHFKKRASDILNAYISVFPEVEARFPSDTSYIIEEIYDIYRRNGFFYHSAYRLSPATQCMGKFERCYFYRGIAPEMSCFMSGLGFYGFHPGAIPCVSVAKMFDVERQPLSQFLQALLIEGEWNDIIWPDDTEFLRMKPPFSRGYWQKVPTSNTSISMARYGYPDKIYVLYRSIEKNFQQKVIPIWILDDFRTIGKVGYGEYRRIACALLGSIHQLPAIRVVRKNDSFVINIDYRLPPEEEDFFKLYSWPVNYNITPETPQVFHREMSADVYPMFNNHLKSIGFCIEEV